MTVADTTEVTEPVEDAGPTTDETTTGVVEPDTEEAEDDEPADDAETFPRSYVEKLRRENQRYREQAATADTLAQRLHTALVAATGKLADPSDLKFDTAHLDDEDTMAVAIDELLTRKPHLATRRPFGDIGQGASPSASTVDLAALLRQGAT